MPNKKRKMRFNLFQISALKRVIDLAYSAGLLLAGFQIDGRKNTNPPPIGENGKNIGKENYETIKQAILTVLQDKELTHAELFDQLNKSLTGTFSGNISWYGETVKLDLEARKVIERTPSKLQKYRLK